MQNNLVAKHLFVTPKWIRLTFTVIRGHVQNGEKMCHPPRIFPAEAEPGNARLLISAQIVDKCPFLGDLSVVLCFLCWWQWWWWFGSLKWPQASCWSAAQCPKLMGKIRVLDELHSGMNYSATGWEFNANESTIYIKWGVPKQKHT